MKYFDNKSRGEITSSSTSLPSIVAMHSIVHVVGRLQITLCWLKNALHHYPSVDFVGAGRTTTMTSMDKFLVLERLCELADLVEEKLIPAAKQEQLAEEEEDENVDPPAQLCHLQPVAKLEVLPMSMSKGSSFCLFFYFFMFNHIQ
ncbi:unnamed protein product [Hymenolepis diminuta]|uniref:Uncharacterized protein n=1 Tax=Hymenolepis diminuta TaxID=6216 RepID=A0A0R3SJV5_HYMDI|nr:unnamed protein product [Hymenolepis diminuta]